MRPCALLERPHVYIRHEQKLTSALFLEDDSGDDDLDFLHEISLASIVNASFGDRVVSPYIVPKLRKDYFPSFATFQTVLCTTIYHRLYSDS